SSSRLTSPATACPRACRLALTTLRSVTPLLTLPRYLGPGVRPGTEMDVVAARWSWLRSSEGAPQLFGRPTAPVTQPCQVLRPWRARSPAPGVPAPVLRQALRCAGAVGRRAP